MESQFNTMVYYNAFCDLRVMLSKLAITMSQANSDCNGYAEANRAVRYIRNYAQAVGDTTYYESDMHLETTRPNGHEDEEALNNLRIAKERLKAMERNMKEYMKESVANAKANKEERRNIEGVDFLALIEGATE